MSPLRGRRGWERKVDEQVEREAAERDAQRATERISRAAARAFWISRESARASWVALLTSLRAACTPAFPSARRSRRMF